MLRWAEAVFFIAGIAALAWCGLMTADAIVSQRMARGALEAASHAAMLARDREPERAAGTLGAGPPRARGSAIAELSIPRVRLSAVVLHGSDEATLRRGPGHLENTALPGEAGNVVIAGHRDSFFRPLRHVRVGDDVFVETVRERIHYRVASLRVVNPYDLSVLDAADADVLTLITCYPFQVVGSAPDRFVVRATRVADPGPFLAARTVPLFEPPDAPVRQPMTEPPEPMTPRTPAGDETLVREAVERFRLTYNGRLARHGEARPDGALTFLTCERSFAGDAAAATCAAASHSPDDGAGPVWFFILERAGGAWAIRSIEVR
jgi:sortase A